MPLSQINNVNIISNTCAIGSKIIIPKNAKLLSATNRNLRDLGHQIIRYAVWVFADIATFMRANRIEVP